MALSTYAELQTAISGEFRRGDDSVFVAAIPDFVNRAEAKINRNLRLREQEVVSTASYDTSNTARLLSMPTGFIELLGIDIKESTEDDTEYVEMIYQNPDTFYRYYEGSGKPQYYTIRDRIEFERVAGTTYTVRIHYLKGWDLAADSTNWLLTNYPDIYLYGACMEAAMYLKMHYDKPQILAHYKTLFDEGLADLNKLDERSRNDAELDTSDFTTWRGRGVYDIKRNRW